MDANLKNNIDNILGLIELLGQRLRNKYYENFIADKTEINNVLKTVTAFEAAVFAIPEESGAKEEWRTLRKMLENRMNALYDADKVDLEMLWMLAKKDIPELFKDLLEKSFEK
jgi:uncharacterized protein with HEPN domain